MSDLENQEFRECAIALVRLDEDERFTKFLGHAPSMEARSAISEREVNLLARGMEMAAQESGKFVREHDLDMSGPHEIKYLRAVASRISSRIKGENNGAR